MLLQHLAAQGETPNPPRCRSGAVVEACGEPVLVPVTLAACAMADMAPPPHRAAYADDD